MASGIKAFIFDLGGVILRTKDFSFREKLAQIFQTTRAEMEDFVFSSPSSLLTEIGKKTHKGHWQTVLRHFSAVNISVDEAYRQFFSGDELNIELLNYIHSLREKYKIGLLSNAWTNSRENLSQLFDFLGFFDESLFSAEIGIRKPEPGIFWEMLNRLNVEAADSVFIDDFNENIEGASDVGLKTIHYIDNAATIQAIQNYLK